MSLKINPEDALKYHKYPQPGKLEISPSKPLNSQVDLALAYSPGVAEPCQRIAANPEDAYLYTSKSNLVGVITNGTAVLGLGDIGAQASKPVMEGKAVLFKKFAGIDVFDIELDCNDPETFIQTVKAMEPTFGGINLEDIKAPESFEIEQRLNEELNIPVMHDDQHGTAIISGAALLNALDLVGKRMEDLKLVVLGAGTAAIACTNFYLSLGVRAEHVVMVDKEGVMRKDSISPDDVRYAFASDRDIHTFEDAIKGADMLLGLSVGNIVKPEHLKKMAANPIVFALANPTPEIDYNLAMQTREDVVMATGRSDFPNQVNNVLGFPYIFRGALDVKSTTINEEMKLAAAHAIADLARQTVPDSVNQAYADTNLKFGKDYLIPKPLDPRLLTTISPAVAKAAIKSGVARSYITDWQHYEHALMERVGMGHKLLHRITNQAKQAPKRVVFAEANNYRILKAAQIVKDDGIAHPILLGNLEEVQALIKEHDLDLKDCPVIDPREENATCREYGQKLYEKRQRKGVTQYGGMKLMRDRNYFGSMMVELGLADAMISGQTKDYPKAITPALQVVGVAPGIKNVAGMYIINTRKGLFFFADCTVNPDPSAEDLVEITGITAKAVRFYGIEPRIAMLSYSNFGSSKGASAKKMQQAVHLAKERFPELLIDGEVQANIAINARMMEGNYPFSELAEKGANTLIFPNLDSSNISYKLLQEIGDAEVIGPILVGMNKPVHILQLGSSVRDIVNMVAVSVIDAQTPGKGSV